MWKEEAEAEEKIEMQSSKESIKERWAQGIDPLSHIYVTALTKFMKYTNRPKVSIYFLNKYIDRLFYLLESSTSTNSPSNGQNNKENLAEGGNREPERKNKGKQQNQLEFPNKKWCIREIRRILTWLKELIISSDKESIAFITITTTLVERIDKMNLLQQYNTSNSGQQNNTFLTLETALNLLEEVLKIEIVQQSAPVELFHILFRLFKRSSSTDITMVRNLLERVTTASLKHLNQSPPHNNKFLFRLIDLWIFWANFESEFCQFKQAAICYESALSDPLVSLSSFLLLCLLSLSSFLPSLCPPSLPSLFLPSFSIPPSLPSLFLLPSFLLSSSFSAFSLCLPSFFSSFSAFCLCLLSFSLPPFPLPSFLSPLPSLSVFLPSFLRLCLLSLPPFPLPSFLSHYFRPVTIPSSFPSSLV